MLVIDDNITEQEVLSRSLSSLSRSVAFASIGLVGETLFLISPHDLVIIHLQMPLMNVWELSRVFKERSRRIRSLSQKGSARMSLGRRGTPWRQVSRSL